MYSSCYNKIINKHTLCEIVCFSIIYNLSFMLYQTMYDQHFIKMFCHCLKKFLKNIDGCLIDRSPIRVNTDLSREDFLEIFRKSAEFSGNSRNSTKTRFYDHQFWHVFPETLFHSYVLHRI